MIVSEDVSLESTFENCRYSLNKSGELAGGIAQGPSLETLTKLIDGFCAQGLERGAAASLAVASANAHLIKSILGAIVSSAAASKLAASLRQSSEFRVVNVQGQSEALHSLLVELEDCDFGKDKSATEVRCFAALKSSLAVMESLCALICGLQAQEPSEEFQAEELVGYLRGIGEATAVVRKLCAKSAGGTERIASYLGVD